MCEDFYGALSSLGPQATAWFGPMVNPPLSTERSHLASPPLVVLHQSHYIPDYPKPYKILTNCEIVLHLMSDYTFIAPYHPTPYACVRRKQFFFFLLLFYQISSLFRSCSNQQSLQDQDGPHISLGVHILSQVSAKFSSAQERVWVLHQSLKGCLLLQEQLRPYWMWLRGRGPAVWITEEVAFHVLKLTSLRVPSIISALLISLLLQGRNSKNENTLAACYWCDI